MQHQSNCTCKQSEHVDEDWRPFLVFDINCPVHGDELIDVDDFLYLDNKKPLNNETQGYNLKEPGQCAP